MAWNYRMFRETETTNGHEEAIYTIREVYYNDDGAITGWAEEACGPAGASMEELSNDLAWFIKALTRPVLSVESAKEIEPAALLADELIAAAEKDPQSFPDMLLRSKGSA